MFSGVAGRAAAKIIHRRGRRYRREMNKDLGKDNVKLSFL